jgi:hypothetical protein
MVRQNLLARATALWLWGSRSRPVPLTWVLGALGRQGMIAGRVVAAAVPDLSQAIESAVVAWSLVGV